jgi:hypothetical protein
LGGGTEREEGEGGRVMKRMYCVRPQWQEPLKGRRVGVGGEAEAIAGGKSANGAQSCGGSREECGVGGLGKASLTRRDAVLGDL